MKSTIYAVIAAAGLLLLSACGGQKPADSAPADGLTAEDSARLTSVQFQADSAFAEIVTQCAFGPRVPGTQAHVKCGDHIAARFKAMGLSVTEQKADLRAFDGTVLPSRNIIAAYRPELKERVMLCAHWDSRPWCDADPDTALHRQPVLAANDGASGVAVMLEVARQLKALNPAVGVDFICFDSEDYGAPYWAAESAPADGSDWCLGSQHWAANPHVPGYTARYGILLDMVGGRDARFCYEGTSMRYAKSVMLRVWDCARILSLTSLFVPVEGGWAQDDHVPVNEVAGIPCIDIIPCVPGERSFGATWHTAADTPENISTETLRGVGQTVLQMLSEEK